MNVRNAILSRRSHREFSPEPLERQLINSVIKAALWAPSPNNEQPWEFIVITDDKTRERLVELCRLAAKKGSIEIHGYSYVRPAPVDYAGNEAGGPEQAADKQISLDFLENVPVFIAVVGIPGTGKPTDMKEKEPDGYKYACGAAVENMLIASEDLGLGSLWFTAFDRTTVGNLLNVEKHKHLTAIVCLGNPSGPATSPGRLPLDEKVRYIP